MKQQLKQIYDDLSRGRLSQEEALEKISALKQHEQDNGLGTLLVRPVWKTNGVEMSAGAGGIESAEHHVVVCDRSAVDVERLRSLLPHGHCLALQAAQEQTIAQRYSEYALACFERIQTILQGRPQGKVLVQIVIEDHEERALLAGLSGLLKTAALENPQFIGQLILVPAGMVADELVQHLQEEKLRGLDALVRYGQGTRQVQGWEEFPADPGTPPMAFKDRGVYLITGGLGALGVLFAKEILARTGQARVVLTGRSALSAEKQALVRELSAQGDRVSYRQLDLGDLRQVTQLIAAVKEEYGQLDGILHSAGMLADNFILKKSRAEFSEVLAPKVIGTFNLDEATRGVALDFFVLFSSFAAAMGNVGQADYAAANSFMDQFAAYRNGQVAAGRRFGRTRSIDWPLWQAGGMNMDPTTRAALEQATGLRSMQTATGLHAFYRTLAMPCDQVLVLEGDLTQMRVALLSGRPLHPGIPVMTAEERPCATGGVATEIDRDDLFAKTEAFLRKECSELLKLPAQKIDPQAALEKYGIDSILAMKLTTQLEKTFGVLSKTLFFEYQTIRELTQYFIEAHSARLSTLFPATQSGDVPVKRTEQRPQTQPSAPTSPISRWRSSRRGAAPGATTEPDSIAIIGLSGRYPEAADLEVYWDNLREGKDCIVEVPKERWDWREYFSEDRTLGGHHYSKWGGFIAGVDEFDPLFFNISPKEAKLIDPQERLFLQHAWMAIEDAGYTRARLQLPCEDDLPGQVGVYVGVMYNEYQLFGVEASARGNRMGVVGSAASIANRVSYSLNLHGPSVTLDTMCSSSLTAIHFACQDLKLGRTSLAIAGGVNVSIHPNKYLVLSAGQFISSDGACQSFGEGGDGYIPGEGVGVVVLKRLSEARRDGDHIYGIIRGSALNHGGKTNGSTVPNPQAQATAISRALAESHTDARHVSYIEAHGTGTKLGDPIEIAALNKAFQKYTQDTEFCLLGSAKSNIGHCESAAGIAGLTKVLLQMQHRQIVPSLHSARLNPHIDFAKSPFVVNQTLRPWEQPEIDGRKLPRIAGISSFGAGGSNAHLIIEEDQAPAPAPIVMSPVVILLSARTPEQLQQKARDLLDFVRARQSNIDLVAMAYTLQVGREAMDERLGLIVSSAGQLTEKLQAYVAGAQQIEDTYQGQVRRSREALSLFGTDADLQQTVDKWIATGKLSNLLDLWVKGLELDWSKLYGEATPRRISLPTYPFAKERYWIDVTAGAPAAARNTVSAALHPLLHTNTSDLNEQRYSSTFFGDELFLTDYAGQKALPGVACLEMARAAIDRALPERPETTVLELRDTVWTGPIVVNNGEPISIALFANGDAEIDYEIYSRDADSEMVHCRGRAVVSHEPAPAALNLAGVQAQIAQGIQSLTHLRLPEVVEKDAGDYVLHPILLERALQAASALLGGAVERLPRTLESLRIFSTCTKEMAAWARYGLDGNVDLDLCDEQGNVCAQLRGLTWQTAAAAIVEPTAVRAVSPAIPAAQEKIAIAGRPPREIAFIPHTEVAPALLERKKPAPISLAAPGAVDTAATRSAGRLPIALPNAAPPVTLEGSAASAASSVRLYDRGDGVFAIEITASGAIAHVRQALDRVRQETSLKVLMIRGGERCFERGGHEDYNEAVGQKLYDALVSFPYPVVAVLPGDAIGGGFLFAALCDFMVCSEDAQYGFTDARRGLVPSVPVEALFIERFGNALAQDVLYVSTVSTGRQLRAKGWTGRVVPATQVEASAQELASTLAGKSREALSLLKEHLTRRLAGLVESLTRIEASPESTENPAKRIAVSASHLRLETPAENVLVITLNGQAGARDLIADLGQLFAEMQHNGDAKAVVLASERPEFLPEIPEDVVLEFQRLIGQSKIPVIAALAGNAKGDAWLVSQFCDAAVYSHSGAYSSARAGESATLAATAAATFAFRFGADVAMEILLTGADYSGADLQRRAGAVIVAAEDRVLSTAVSVAESWAALPRTSLASRKQRTAATIQDKIAGLSLGEQQDDTFESPLTATPIALQSRVVSATAHPSGIVVVRMEEREAKNMFSDALMAGMSEVFAHIERTPAYKVVILTGYDQYFASGGTKESLLAIQAGTVKFTDSRIFQIALDCKLPVIAAMQGHGIGAGWSMGMFADIALLSEESRYVSPYMNYGFTPGAGATWSLLHRIGQDLARESLLTGETYTGSALKARGLLLPVLPRAEIYAAALTMAQRIAGQSRHRVIGLKRLLNAGVREALEETVQLELAMHEKTFVGRSDTLAQIQGNFHQEAETPPPAAPPQRVEPARPREVGDLLPAISATLRTLLANELQMRESDIDDQAQFVDLGLDSISGVSWIRKINEKYQTTIEATKVYSYPTLTQLSRYVKEEAEAHGTLQIPVAPPVETAPVFAKSIPPHHNVVVDRAAAKRTPRRRRAASRFGDDTSSPRPAQPIAIIGMAGQFPRANNLDEFWRNIAEGKNCITPVPNNRWDVNAYYQPGAAVPGKTNSQWLGALDGYDLFDPRFFNISPTEAESMDPQQRLFLEACWHSIENAGYDARTLSGSKCGVFVGCAATDYHQVSRQHQLSAHGFTGAASSILASRISYFLNLQGPCVSIDTACSSSLVAMAQACDSLNSGDSDLAMAGGVYVMSGPEMHIRTAQAGMLSPEGQCFTFDQRADGFVPGEGVGVVVLKRLADAQRDQDVIYGVIEGWGVNQDGKTNGITAPNPESQTRLEQSVYDKYEIDPANIQLIEAHGTGTKLGDPIEVEGLKAAFKKYTQKKEYCAIGSIKSNIGHCLTAAGIAGVIKLLLALKHKQLPPTVNFERLNEHIDLTESPFYVNTKLQEWKLDGAPRRLAAISSFGFSGTNAHIVIGEVQPPVAVRQAVSAVPPNTQTLIPLSARTPEQLQQKARDLLAFIRKEMRSADLSEIAYTLQVGRVAMDERLAFVVSSVEQLANKLQVYVDGAQGIEDAYQGQLKRHKEALSLFIIDVDLQQTIDKWIVNRKLARLADLWVKGLEIDWNKLYGEARPRRISLPAYPFARERYWIDVPAGKEAAGSGPAAAVLHPLLHSNTSDLSEQRFRSIFTGEEPFVTDDAGQKVLPAVAYLEMARAAIEQALPLRSESAVLELRDTVWAQPIVVNGRRQVSISLLAEGEERIAYEIYSQDAGQEIVHCQGHALLSHEPAPAELDVELLRAQMEQGDVDADSVYASYARMGLVYGPVFRGIVAIHRGNGQLLADLRLPSSVAETAGDYGLHPSVMDGALQAALALTEGGSDSNRPRLPFALETLRIVSPCASDMVAWVRYPPASQAADDVVKLDIDLCDARGMVCVQMRGLSSRRMSTAVASIDTENQTLGRLIATPAWLTSDIDKAAAQGGVRYSEHHVILCALPAVDAEALEALVPRSQCRPLSATPNGNLAQRYSEYALGCFEQIQAILLSKPSGKVLMHVVVADDEEYALAGLSALLKTAALENPHFNGQLMLVSADISAEELSRNLQNETTGALDPLIRYERGVRQILRWHEVASDTERPPIAFKDHGVYLITGGLGGLGLLFAREILGQTLHARVILTGRSASSPELQTRLDELSPNSERVSYRQVDLGDLDQIERLIAEIRDEYQGLNGILHCAGMNADNAIVKKTAAEFSGVLAPKVTGTFNLDQASRDVELDFFVLFSSIAGALGNVGQADYAAANGFMDQFAAYRDRLVAAKQRHGRTRSINWSLWQAGRMQIDRASQELAQQAIGVRPMQTATGMQAFHRSLASPYGQLLVVEGNWQKMTAYLQKTRIFEGPLPAAADAPVRREIAEMEAPVSLSQLQQQIKGILANVLGIEASAIDADEPFVDFGLDSFLGAELVVAVNKKYGTELSHMRLFDYSTVREFAQFLQQEIGKLPRSAAKPAVPAVRSSAPAVSSFPVLVKMARAGRRTAGAQTHSDDKIAIIGMSGRYPQANDLNQYWENLVEGRNAIVEVPPSRWDVNQYYDADRTRKDKTYSKWLGAVDDVDRFDPLFFRISPQEAEYIDPQHRLFLQESYKAFEDAGYSTATLSNKKCGVYLGISTHDYMALLSRNGILSAPVTSNSYAIAAARIAYYLNLKGPAISVDTACSSALVAIHLACQAIQSGEIDMALAGGVSLWLTPESYVAMSQAGMFSPVGQCKTFDDGADGIVNGEGVGAVVLKRLKDAQEDGDVIYGVILGSGINQDGRTNGITAPSVNSQIELERAIYAKYEIDPETISYVETHGTGTKLGDPIELEALSTVFREKTSRKNFCALGSVKSNIGHTTSAAGVAGLQKVLLSMQHRTLVPTLNVTKENSRFDFRNSPFYISRETKVWDVAPDSPRRAAVSSFGFSGTNAHLVVEEYRPPAEAALPLSENAPVVVPLSARTVEQLRQKSRDLLEFIRAAQQPVDLAALAYTLQIGREAMEERVGCVVSSVEQLADVLSAYVNGAKNVEGLYQGRVEPGSEGMTIIGRDDDMQETIDKWIARKKLGTLLDLWIRGLTFDWNKLYGDVKPRRISLPTYPFARERCWIDDASMTPELVSRFTTDADMKSIEDIINQIDEDAIETGHAVQALKMLV